MSDRTSNRRNRPADDLRSIDELAELWSVSARTVQRQIKSGALRAYRIGRLLRVSAADAEDFLKRNRED
jgi:excisionase family DNA binding protein